MPPKHSKPVRHWPGKAPQFAQGDHSSGSDSSDNEQDQQRPPKPSIAATPALPYTRIDVKPLEENQSQRSKTSRHHGSVKESASAAAVSKVDAEERRKEDVKRQEEDRRLKRIQSAMETSSRRRRGRVDEDEQDVDKNKVEEDQDAEAALEDRRALIRRKALLRQQQEEEEQQRHQASKGRDAGSESEESSSGSGESESDDSEDESSDDGYPGRKLAKPVFIPKTNRETVLEKEKLAQEQQEAEARRLKEAEERKKESHFLVQEELQKEIDSLEKAVEVVDIDDADGLNEEEEYEAWKVRELLRIKREREERFQRDEELLDIERRRNMTDAEVREENKKLGKVDVEKQSMRFMQRYYHKGAFFTDDNRVAEALEKTDVMAPTLEDRFDRSILPSVLQVKNFGKAGRTKYTHLADQDTTQRDAGWTQKSDITQKTIKKMAAMEQSFEKPAAKRIKRSE